MFSRPRHWAFVAAILAASPVRAEPAGPRGDASGWVAFPGVYFASDSGLFVSVTGMRYCALERATRPSHVKGAVFVNFDGQLSASLQPTLWLRGDRVFVDSGIDGGDRPLRYYGIGPDAPLSNEEQYDRLQLKLWGGAGWKLVRGVYLGGLGEVRWVDVRDPTPGGELATGAVAGADGSRIAGIGAFLRWDTRDHSFFPTRGHRLRVAPLGYHGVVGSEHDYVRLLVEGALYRKVSGDHVVAAGGVADLRWGEPPFDALANVGGSELLRGLPGGRFRDQHGAAVEVEYRSPLVWRLRGVVFAGAGSVAPRLSAFSVGDVTVTGGAGLRFAVRPADRIHVRLDAGFGVDGPQIYFDMLEAF
jgi:hypothetical protein